MHFGHTNAASRVVYIVVGICALYELASLPALFQRGSRRHFGRSQPAL
jgi:uncharacterized membrane protein YuzA (DUF378 family)